MEEHFRKIAEDTDKRVQRALKIQVLNQEHPSFGGFPDENEVIHAKYAIYRIAPMLSAYLCPECRYYQDETIWKRILAGLSYVKHCQHENGLFDYVLCNFNSAPDTAFCMKKLIPFYEYFTVHKRNPKEEQLVKELGMILKKGADGLLNGGFHTPNHRWAIASVLLWCAEKFKILEYRTMAETYLQEGIDCNEDGEYSEKSAGNYNRINNDAMILIAQETKEERYEQYAVQNLNMLLTYLEPDGSIFTANSTRYDKDHLVYPKDYYLQYLYLGMKYQKQEFLSMASYLFEIIQKKELSAPDILIHFLNHPEYRTFTWNAGKLPDHFSCFYSGSAIARIRQGKYLCTLIGNKPDFLYFSYGKLHLELRLCGSFYQYRSFQAEKLSMKPDGTVSMVQTMRGWYYLPLKEKPESSDWWSMDLSQRERLTGSEYDMELEVKVFKLEHGVKLKLKTSGVSGAPFRLVFALSGVNVISGESFVVPVTGGEQIMVREGMVYADSGEETIEFGPGFSEHRLLSAKEYAEQPAAAQATVYFTALTEFEREIIIQGQESSL